MTTNHKAEAAELTRLLGTPPNDMTVFANRRELFVLQDLAKIGAHVLTVASLDYNGDGRRTMDEEIQNAAQHYGWLDPHSYATLPYYMELAAVLDIDPSDYGIEPDPLAFHDPARTPVERGVLREDMSNAYREYVAAGTDYIDRLHALQSFTDKLADYAGVEVVAP